MTNPIRAQGAEAKKQELTEFDCPYGPGENRDAWMAGFGGKTEEVRQPPAPKPSADDQAKGEVVRKGKKGAETAAVQKLAPGGETSLVTTTETADPTQADGPAGEVVIGDPSASSLAAGGGDGMQLEPKKD